MNKSLFTTAAEVKTILGITGTDLDAAIDMYLQAACNQVCEIIGAYDLLRFVVSEEEVVVQNPEYLTPEHMPIDWTQSVTVKNASGSAITDTLFRNLGELRTIRRKDANGNILVFGESYYRVSYTAGFATVADVPMELKMLAALMVQASILKIDRAAMSAKGGNATKTPGQVKRYSFGTKSVEYFDPAAKSGSSGFGAAIDFKATADEWASKFKKFKGFC